MKVDYLFTTFPTLSETFYQREVRALLALGVEVRIFSLWGGATSFDGVPVRRFHKWRLAELLWWIPYWCVRRPRTMLGVLRRLVGSVPPTALNLMETLLGLTFALVHARELAPDRRGGDLMHAAWATAPGTAAQLVGGLTGRSFCQGAHAYDVFRDGGDWWLRSKLREAAAVVTSTGATRAALIERGACPVRLHLIRRGLNALAPMPAARRPRTPLRLLCVGRLIEKKGYFEQLAVYAALAAAGIAFEARIVGEGPLRRRLAGASAALGLGRDVTLLGQLPYDQTALQYDWADLFVYTGKVAGSGDRDGLPNVIPEAMSAGVPVVSSPVAGIPEAIVDGATGYLLDPDDVDAWVARIARLGGDDAVYDAVRRRAREWVEQEFDAMQNARKLIDVWRAVQDRSRPGT